MDCIVVVVAAGSGKRMGGKKAKQFLPLDDKPILAHTLVRLSNIDNIDGLILVVPEKDIQYCRIQVIEKFNIKKVINIVPGGRRRQDSVMNGLNYLADINPNYVLIHDGVRPFFSSELIGRILSELRICSGVIPGMKVVCTIKKCDENGFIQETLPRRMLWEIQTPQGFCFDLIYEAYKKVHAGNIDITDDAMAVELLGNPVKIIEGNKENIKITRPLDIVLANEIILKSEGLSCE